MAQDYFRPLVDRRTLRQLLGIDDSTLYRKIKAGKIRPPHDVAGLQRWRPEYVDELIGADEPEDAEAA